MPRMMGSVTRVSWLTSPTVSPARRRAAASVAPMLTRASSHPPGPMSRSYGCHRTAAWARAVTGRERHPFGGKLRTPAAQGGTLGPGLVGESPGEGDEPGPQGGAIGALRGAEDTDGEQARVARAADRDGRDRDA